MAHGEYAVRGAGTTQRPRIHAQRPRRYVHSPSIQTAPLAGDGGTTSTRAGGGAIGTDMRAVLG
jgi:hypothetical protein